MIAILTFIISVIILIEATFRTYYSWLKYRDRYRKKEKHNALDAISGILNDLSKEQKEKFEEAIKRNEKR